MDMTTALSNLANDCIQACTSAKKEWLKMVVLLYEVKKQEAWKGKAESWSEFVEQDCGLNRSQIEVHLSVYEHYAIEGGVSTITLAKVEPYRAHTAMKLKGTPEQQLSKALSLTRRELKDSMSDEGHVCEPITVCKTCHKRIYDSH